MPRVPFPANRAIGLFAVAATQAEERRGFRVPISVPGLSDAETIQKVPDLPDVAALKRSNGKYVDLGYLHIGGGEGEWIGYIGSSQTYLPVDEFELKTLLKIAGMLPPSPVPERPGGGYRSWSGISLPSFLSLEVGSRCGGVASSNASLAAFYAK